MPIFETESDVVLTPQEFFDACSVGEQLRLKGIIEDEFDLVSEHNVPELEEIISPPHPRSVGQQVFNDALTDLGESWYSITKFDEEIVLAIAKKHHTI
jgi:hypothetical protein